MQDELEAMKDEADIRAVQLEEKENERETERESRERTLRDLKASFCHPTYFFLAFTRTLYDIRSHSSATDFEESIDILCLGCSCWLRTVGA